MWLIVRWLMMLAVVFGLSACGGGGGNPGSSNNPDENKNNGDEEVVVVTNKDPEKTTVKLDVAKVELDDISQYSLISSTGNQISAGKSKILDLDIDKSTRDVIALIDKGGQPILMGRKLSGESEVEVSLESSAELMVLVTPRFNGNQVNNPKELSRRIRRNKLFPELVEKIKKEIDKKNPCPLNPICNYEASTIAVKIANDLDIDNLYTGGK